MGEIRTIRNVSALSVRGASERGHCREATAINLISRDETETNILGDEQISKVLIIRSASQNRSTWASLRLFRKSLSPSVEKKGLASQKKNTCNNPPFFACPAHLHLEQPWRRFSTMWCVLATLTR